MRRIIPLIVAMISSSAFCGCGELGLFRSVGHLPGVAPTDYAFYDFCGTSSQLYQFSLPQVESSMMVALGDMGFKVAGPPDHQPDGETCIKGHTPDGRSFKTTIKPQGNLTNVRIKVGPDSLGDYELSRDLHRRVALNLGTAMRAYTPVELDSAPAIELLDGHPAEGRVESPDRTQRRRPAAEHQADSRRGHEQRNAVRRNGCGRRGTPDDSDSKFHADASLSESSEHALCAVPLHPVQ